VPLELVTGSWATVTVTGALGPDLDAVAAAPGRGAGITESRRGVALSGSPA